MGLLKKLYKIFLRTVTKVLNTTATDTLVALGMPPLDLLVMFKAEVTTYGLLYQRE